MALKKYILDENNEMVQEHDLIEWARWWEVDENRAVAYTEIAGDIEVSTVFMGFNLSLSKEWPLYYETLVRGPIYSKNMGTQRYSTRERALEGHKAIVESIQKEIG